MPTKPNCWKKRCNNIIFYSDRKLTAQSYKNRINSHFLWLFLLSACVAKFLFVRSLFMPFSVVDCIECTQKLFTPGICNGWETLLPVVFFRLLLKMHTFTIISDWMCRSLNGSIISIFTFNYKWNSTCTQNWTLWTNINIATMTEYNMKLEQRYRFSQWDNKNFAVKIDRI